MIVSRLKIDFADAPWAAMNSARSRAQEFFQAVVARETSEESLERTERLSLGELLYRALVEPAEVMG